MSLERVGEQVVMLDAGGTVARGLNETAAQVWELIDGSGNQRSYVSLAIDVAGALAAAARSD